MRSTKWLFPVLLLLVVPVAELKAQFETQEQLSGRWVGLRHPPWRPALWLEFMEDSSLVVNDRHRVSYYLTPDSLVTTQGDSIFRVSYRLAAGYLVVETNEGEVITMSPQSPLARPLVGERWIGDMGPEVGEAELEFFNGGRARWRMLPDGQWQGGSWDRQARFLTFSWPILDSLEVLPDSIPPDSSSWRGIYDAFGNTILFDSTVTGSTTSIFSRLYR